MSAARYRNARILFRAFFSSDNNYADNTFDLAKTFLIMHLAPLTGSLLDSYKWLI